MSQSDFASTCTRHQDDLLAYARRLCGGDADQAADVVQDTMLKAFRAWGDFEPDGDPEQCVRAWLYTIVSNTFMKYHRYARHRSQASIRRPEDVLRSCAPEDAEVVMEDRATGVDRDHTRNRVTLSVPPPETHELSEELTRAIARLTPAHQEVVTRCYLGGQTCQEIADAIGVPFGTVTQRLTRARAKLATDLRAHAATLGIGLGRPVIVIRPGGLARLPQPAKTKASKRVEPQADSVNRVVARKHARPLVGRQAPAHQPAAG